MFSTAKLMACCAKLRHSEKFSSEPDISSHSSQKLANFVCCFLGENLRYEDKTVR